jgi:hypothetical protein
MVLVQASPRPSRRRGRRRAVLAAVGSALALGAACASLDGLTGGGEDGGGAGNEAGSGNEADGRSNDAALADTVASGDDGAGQEGGCPAFCDGAALLCDDFSGANLLLRWFPQVPDGGEIELVDGSPCSTAVRIGVPPSPFGTGTSLGRQFALPDAAALSCTLRIRKVSGNADPNDWVIGARVLLADSNTHISLQLFPDLGIAAHFQYVYVGTGPDLSRAQPGGFGAVTVTYRRTPPTVALTTDNGTRSFAVDASVWSANADISIGPLVHGLPDSGWTLDYEDVVCDVTY